jgi:hypothetical protein
MDENANFVLGTWGRTGVCALGCVADDRADTPVCPYIMNVA